MSIVCGSDELQFVEKERHDDKRKFVELPRRLRMSRCHMTIAIGWLCR